MKFIIMSHEYHIQAAVEPHYETNTTMQQCVGLIIVNVSNLHLGFGGWGGGKVVT
jgi:hypothetical protein